MLQWEILERPELHRLLEGIHEVEGNLVSSGKLYRVDWIRHAELLKLHNLTEVWVFTGKQGVGKSSTTNSIANILKQQGWTVTTTCDKPADAWVCDDLGQHFSKRDFGTAKGKEIARFLQIVRTLFHLVITNAPSLEDLDKSIREAQIGETIRTVSPGFAIWRGPLQVVPVWQNEDWRVAYAEKLHKLLESK